MCSYRVNTPVAFIVFNRPTLTERVFRVISEAKPRQLFLVADGPRSDRPGEAESCAAVRAIVDRVDWECEVHRNYSDANLGCGLRISSGLNWVFSIAGRAIILEDDCLPHPTFFRFCEELLDRYDRDERVGAISGDNFNITPRKSASYFFSIFPLIWGWATWARAWKHHDLAMQAWPKARKTALLRKLFWDRASRKYWQYLFDETFRRKIDTWDYQWTFACWLRSFLTVVPEVNLVSNIGLDENSTHTFESSTEALQCHLQPMHFPLSHPKLVRRDAFADNQIKRRVFRIKSFPGRVQAALSRVANRLIRSANEIVGDLPSRGRNR